MTYYVGNKPIEQSASAEKKLKGKWVTFVGDSLLADCRVFKNGNYSTATYSDLSIADRDEGALGYQNVLGPAQHVVGDTCCRDKSVNYPYWVCKQTGCIAHNLGSSGKTMFDFALANGYGNNVFNEDVNSPYWVWQYKNIGQVTAYGGYNYIDRSKFPPIDEQGGYLLMKEYTPDYVIIAFGTNDINKLNTPSANKRIGSYEGCYLANSTYEDGDKYDLSQLWGAWAKVIHHVQNKFPEAKIGIIIDGHTDGNIRNFYLRIRKMFGIQILDLQTRIGVQPMYFNVQGWQTENHRNPTWKVNPTYDSTLDYPKGCRILKDGKTYECIRDIEVGETFDEKTWVEFSNKKMTALSPVPLGKAIKAFTATISGISYEAGQDIFHWGDYNDNLYSHDRLHPTLDCAKVKGKIIADWLETL